MKVGLPSCQVSPNLMFLGTKLRQLFLEHGNFGAVESEIKKSTSNEEMERLQGGWHNEVSLQMEGWTPPLGSSKLRGVYADGTESFEL